MARIFMLDVDKDGWRSEHDSQHSWQAEHYRQHGWLVLDKPLGMSSAQAVGAVKRLLRPKRIGHGGTLDPLASGILPLGLGEATKTFAYVAAHEKSYRFTVQWGEARSTDDAEGEVTARSDVRPSAADIAAVLPQFHGVIAQVPPIFSAIHVNGQRAYALARAGQEVTLEARNVRIDRLEMTRQGIDFAEFEVDCGQGTYVRSLARDIAHALGTVGYVAALRRTRVGQFHEKDAISLDSLGELVHNAAPFELRPIASVLADIPAIALDASEATALRNGQMVRVSAPSAIATRVLCLCAQIGIELGLAEVVPEGIQPVRVFVY